MAYRFRSLGAGGGGVSNSMDIGMWLEDECPVIINLVSEQSLSEYVRCKIEVYSQFFTLSCPGSLSWLWQ